MTATEASGGTSVRAYSDVEYVFEPHTAEMPALRPYLQELWDRRQFIAETARAEIRGKRSNAVVGQLWALLDPIFQALVYFFLITAIRGSARDVTTLIFCVFMFNLTGIALNSGGKSIVQSRGLMLNSSFPRAMLPLVSIYKGLLGLAPAMVIYLVIHLALGRPISSGVVLLPLLLAIQTVCNIGLAMLVATITVFVRDMTNALTYISRVMLFTTPVIYGAETLSPTIRNILFWLNPYFALFTCYRAIVLGGVPDGRSVIQAILLAAVVFVVGARAFLSHERAFALRL
jgi:ABC-type polysaccharide/polyol phosphate export permease